MSHGSENVFSIFRSVILKVEEFKTGSGQHITTYHDVVAVNVVIKTYKPSVSPNETFWDEVLMIFCRINHVELSKLVLKFVSLDEYAVENLGEIPLLFDLTTRKVEEIESIIQDLRCVCSTTIIFDKAEHVELDEPQIITKIIWDPKDINTSISNLPNPGKWSQRTSTTTIHVVGGCASIIEAPEGYEIFHPVIPDGGEPPKYRVIYYSDGFFEGSCFPSWGDIILLYPGHYYCDWQVKSTFVVPSVEIYGINSGKHEVDLVGSVGYSETCSDGSLIELNSNVYQPYPVYSIMGNMTLTARSNGRPLSIRGGECHVFLFNCSFHSGSYSSILFSPSSRGTLHMQKCFITGAMDSAMIIGRSTSHSNIHKIDVRLIDCKVTKTGRGYLTKPGTSPAISVLNLSSFEVSNCVIRDNVGHAFQFKESKRRPHRIVFRDNILKRNQACDKSGNVACCRKEPAVAISAYSQRLNRVVIRGRYCFSCGAPTRRICCHCRNAFFCNIQCQLENWTSSHQYYCVKS